MRSHDIQYALALAKHHLGAASLPAPRRFWYADPESSASLTWSKANSTSSTPLRIVRSPKSFDLSGWATLPTPHAAWMHMFADADPLPFGVAAPPAAAIPYRLGPYRDIFSELKHVASALEHARRLLAAQRALVAAVSDLPLPHNVMGVLVTAIGDWKPAAAFPVLLNQYENIIERIYASHAYPDHMKTRWRTHRAIQRGRELCARTYSDDDIMAQVGSPFRSDAFGLVVWDRMWRVSIHVMRRGNGFHASSTADGHRVVWSPTHGWEFAPCDSTCSRASAPTNGGWVSVFGACTECEGSRRIPVRRRVYPSCWRCDYEGKVDRGICTCDKRGSATAESTTLEGEEIKEVTTTLDSNPTTLERSPTLSPLMLGSPILGSSSTLEAFIKLKVADIKDPSSLERSTTIESDDSEGDGSTHDGDSTTLDDAEPTTPYSIKAVEVYEAEADNGGDAFAAEADTAASHIRCATPHARSGTPYARSGTPYTRSGTPYTRCGTPASVTSFVTAPTSPFHS